MKYKTYLKQLGKKDATVFFNENLSNHCSFGIGGKAKVFIVVNNLKTLVEIFKREKKVFIIGCGTNILFSNHYFNGTIIKLGGDFLKIKQKSNTIIVGAGVNLFSLNKYLKESNQEGLEFSFGIPGSVGGAITMNAGAFGDEIGNYVKKVKIFDGEKAYWTKNFNFSYRESSFKKQKQIVLFATFKLKPGEKQKIEELQKSILKKRKETQPFGEKSAGSIFKRIIRNNEIIYPAKLIDNLGLKGVKIKDAEISSKHAGFIVNKKNANAKDVLKLICKIKKIVRKKTNESLEEEIIIFKGKRNDCFRRFSHSHNLFKRKT